MTDRLPYQYVVLRCVPRADREEFVNVGVVVYCQATDLLAVASYVDPARLIALDASLDVAALEHALAFVAAVCEGDERVGPAALAPVGQRFGFVKAPRSTVVRPGPVHGGLTHDPEAELERLLQRLVHPPA